MAEPSKSMLSKRSLAVATFLMALSITESFTVSRQLSTRTAIAASVVGGNPRIETPLQRQRRQREGTSRLYQAVDKGDDDEEDDYIDDSSLGDWRTFRRDLASVKDEGLPTSSSTSAAPIDTKKSAIKSVSKENESVLKSQNQDLAEEYLTGVWAHETATHEVGGLVVRMPLEVELYRNYRHSLNGQRLRQLLGESPAAADLAKWYAGAQKLMDKAMQQIATMADDQGQIDATALKAESSEMLTLYLDNQDTWQEVCLVLEKPNGIIGKTRTLVINRPMAMKLTDNLADLVLNGLGEREAREQVDMAQFLRAFGNECAIYVGGPDGQTRSALLIHGISDLEGATEISSGTKIYRGGLDAAIRGVLDGKYSPLEFRFFIGCHEYKASDLDVAIHLGKYQPVACARSVALKQCISLPKPLWHEVMELCGGELENISTFELLKRDDLQFQVVDETEGEFSGKDTMNKEMDEDDAMRLMDILSSEEGIKYASDIFGSNEEDDEDDPEDDGNDRLSYQ